MASTRASTLRAPREFQSTTSKAPAVVRSLTAASPPFRMTLQGEDYPQFYRRGEESKKLPLRLFSGQVRSPPHFHRSNRHKVPRLRLAVPQSTRDDRLRTWTSWRSTDSRRRLPPHEHFRHVNGQPSGQQHYVMFAGLRVSGHAGGFDPGPPWFFRTPAE
jgi:hypothetical protein